MSKNKELKDKISKYLTDTWEDLQRDIESLPEKERTMAKLKLFDYAVPKVQATKEGGANTTSTASQILARMAESGNG